MALSEKRETKDIKVYARISTQLNDRVEELCNYLGCNKANFVSMAISYYTIYQESQREYNKPQFMENLLSNENILDKLSEIYQSKNK